MLLMILISCRLNHSRGVGAEGDGENLTANDRLENIISTEEAPISVSLNETLGRQALHRLNDSNTVTNIVELE